MRVDDDDLHEDDMNIIQHQEKSTVLNMFSVISYLQLLDPIVIVDCR